MSATPGDASSSGRFVRAATKSLGPIDVDCAEWERDMPSEQWSTGKLVRTTQAAPPVEGPFVAADSLELQIALRIEPSMSPARAFVVATRLVAAALVHDLGHGIVCDPKRSAAQEDQVLIVLTPQRPSPNTVARLEKLAEVVRQAANDASGVAINSIHIVRAA